jgi:hypothetical protein
MQHSVRPSTPADAGAIVDLFAAAGLHPNLDPQHLHWKYWQPRADWPGPRSFVLTDGSEALAHGAIVPGAWLHGARRVSIVHMIDWAARPAEAGAGTMLMKHIGRQSEGLLAIGGSAQTLQILPHMGFRPAGVVTGYVRSLFPLRLLTGAGVRRWRRLPRFARGVAGALAAPSAREGEWQARRIAVDELQRVCAALPVAVRGAAVLERSVALFAHALSCPIVAMRLHALERAGRVRGYFLLAAAPGQVRIADCWVDSDEPADWRAMIQHAIEQARLDTQAAEIVGWASDSLLCASLRACGFRARFELPVRIRRTDAASMPPAPLRVQMLDSDAAYLHQGRSEFWT